MNYRIFSPEMQNPIPEKVQRIVRTALNSVNPRQLILENLHQNGQSLSIADTLDIGLSGLKRIFVIGAGKAVVGMAEGLYEVLGDRISGGRIITKHLLLGQPQVGEIEILVGNHPVPGPQSVASAQAVADFTRQLTREDLVLCLITGGGSALMTLPVDEISLAEMQATTDLLLSCGVTINEMNILRKHLEVLKGGGLVRLLYPARVITLILSDVIGNPPDIIASGPTTADPSTFAESWDVLERHAITEQIPFNVRQYILEGMQGKKPETVKPGSQWLDRADTLILGDNSYACQAALREAERAGFRTRLLTNSLHGEASQIGTQLAAMLHEAATTEQPLERPFCMLAGGETTVHLHGNGRGGRNQEMALAGVKILDGLENVAMIALATDGEDGPTDAAGAVVTGETYQSGLAKGMDPDDYLSRNDSWSYFKQIGSGLTPGPTGTNVNDICFLFAW